MEDLVKKIEENNKHFRSGEFSIISKINYRYVLTKTKFGRHKSSIWSLIKGSKPTIKSALSKTKYAINEFKSVQDRDWETLQT